MSDLLLFEDLDISNYEIKEGFKKFQKPLSSKDGQKSQALTLMEDKIVFLQFIHTNVNRFAKRREQLLSIPLSLILCILLDIYIYNHSKSQKEMGTHIPVYGTIKLTQWKRTIFISALVIDVSFEDITPVSFLEYGFLSGRNAPATRF